MIAFLECGKCGKHSTFHLNGVSRCPHCNATEVKRMELGGEKPDWFKESQKDNFFARRLRKK